jgi:hypothetical protein
VKLHFQGNPEQAGGSKKVKTAVLFLFLDKLHFPTAVTVCLLNLKKKKVIFLYFVICVKIKTLMKYITMYTVAT